MLPLTPALRRYLILEQVLMPFAVNLALNAGLAWYLFREHVPLPLWGDPSIGADTLGTLFFLPFFTCMIGTPLIKRAARKGKLERLAIAPEQHWLLRHLPRATWKRAVGIGLACVVAFGPLSIGVLALLGLFSWSLPVAIQFKGIYAGVLAIIVSPPIALYALSQHEAPEPDGWQGDADVARRGEQS